MPKYLSIEDYRRAAKRRLPRLVFDYVDGGAETEWTMRENRRAFESVTLRPRGGMDPSEIDIGVSVLGTRLSTPVILAPCGMTRIVNPAGDLAGARAAAKAGTVFGLSTNGGHSVQDVVAAAAGAPVWYQVYRIGDRATAERGIERARDAGVAAVVVTMDSAVGSLRERDRRSGGMTLLGANRLAAAPHFLKLMTAPGWLYAHMTDEVRPRLRNVLDEDGVPALLGRVRINGLTWEDLSWVRKLWSGPIVIKGLVTAEDAIRAADEGAVAVVVSNHGGRQLDTADATLRALPEVAAAVGDRCEVLLDGGVRSGTDVLKAISLGAKAVLVGRPWVWGLAAAGQAGVDGALQVLTDGVRRNMALLGVKKLSELDPSYVRVPPAWLQRTVPGREWAPTPEQPERTSRAPSSNGR